MILQADLMLSLPGVALLEPVYVAGLPTAFQFRQVNAILAKLLDKTPEALIGQPLTGSFLSLSKQVFCHYLESVCQSKIPYQQYLHPPEDDRTLGLSIQLLDQQLLVIVQPVSQRQPAEQRLQQQHSEHQFQQLLERHQIATQAGGLGIWETDLRRGHAIWDEQMWAIHQLAGSPRRLTVDECRVTVHPDDRLMFARNYQADIESNTECISHNFRIIRPDGTFRHIHMEGRIFRDQQGHPIRALGVSQDVTEQRLAEQQIRASEEQFHQLVDQLDIVIFQVDSSGCWSYLSQAWEAVTGFSVEESLGSFFLDSIMPYDRAICEQLFTDAKAGKRNLGKPVIQYIHQSGGYRWLEVQARVLINDQQALVGASGTLTDITLRKRAEEALIESEQRFRELAENVGELFWIRDIKANKISYLNPTFETFTGLTVEGVYRDQNSFSACVVAEDLPLILAAMFSDESALTYQFRIRHLNGRIRWLTVRALSIFNEAGELIRRIGVATDVSAMIEKEVILEESLRKERRLTALQSQFITTASHEFRTPLAAISSSAELIQHYFRQVPDHLATPFIIRHLNTIFTKVQSLDELISDTLAISKLDEGKVRVCLEETDLVAFCERLVGTTFGERPDSRKVDLTVIGLPVRVLVDKKLLSHILSNLLGNAFKFSATNPDLTIRFGEETLSLAVRDEGIGIPADQLPDLFGKFFRARNALDYQGTGLGLVICREYTLLLEGRLNVASEEGVGTTFTMTLPFPKQKPENQTQCP